MSHSAGVVTTREWHWHGKFNHGNTAVLSR